MITRTRKQVFKLWIAALRSGKYKQGFGLLSVPSITPSRTSYKYCCLGVLCDLAVKDGGQKWVRGGDGDRKFDGEVGAISSKMQRFMGMTGSDVSNLVQLNDDQEKTFAEIADYIETNIMPVACNKQSS